MAGSGDRGVSEVIGAVIIFAFLVISFSVYQGIIVPQQNRAVEFEHNVDVQGEFQDLRNAIRQTATAAAEESISIKLGATYPERFLAVNPGGSAAALQTIPLGNISVRNASAADAEAADYFGNTTTRLGPFESKTIVYQPVYYQYREAPITFYENTLAYNQFPGGANLTITEQAVVDGRQITLVALAGNVSDTGRETVTVDTQAVSTASTAVAVTNESGPVNITFTTRLTVSDWTDILEDELDTPGSDERFVTAVKQTGPDQVSILLEPGVTYELQLAKVGVGTGASAEGPKYVVEEQGHNTSVIENGSQKLVVEVRDRFNNPTSNVTVNATITERANPDDSREHVPAANETTGADGQASFLYSAPENVEGDQLATIEVSFDGDGTANETVTFDVKLLDTDDSSLGGSSDPASEAGDASGLIRLQDTFPPGASEPFGQVVFQVNNTANSSANITGIGLDYATQTDQSGTVEDGPDEVIDITVDGDSRTISAVEGEGPVFFEDDPVTLPGSGTISDIELDLDEGYVLNKNKESLIISVTFYFEGGFSAEYAVYMFNA